MKNYSKNGSSLRNDRNTWLTVAAILSGCALVSSASAQVTITDSTSAPSGNILASQLTDATGAQSNGQNYMNNGGTVGQTFTVGANSTLDSISVLGRGDSAEYYSGGPQPFTAGVIWSIQIASVNTTTGALTPLDIESSSTYVPTGGGANDSAYLTYTLAAPVSLIGGQEYAFNLYVDDERSSAPGAAVGQSWFGLSHSATDLYAGGTAENSDNTDVNNESGPVDAYGAFAAPISGYDYVFAAQGTTVPEPTTLALAGLGGLGLLAAARRRRA